MRRFRRHGALSLRKTLVTRLWISLSIIGVIASVVTYLLAYNYANFAYDRALMDSAESLAKQLTYEDGKPKLNLPPAARTVLLTDRSDQIRFQVKDLIHQTVLARNGDLGTPPERAQMTDHPVYHDEVLHGQTFRIISMVEFLQPDHHPVLVEVGETRHKRDLLAREILVGVVTLMLILVVLSITLVWRGIATTLKPLQVLEVEAAKRSTDNLAPLDPSIAPLEVRALIQAINRLMARLAESIESQRRFTANAAHQLRTPVAGLRLQAQLAQKNREPEVMLGMLRDIEESAARTAHVIDQLLLLSKAEAGSYLMLQSPQQLNLEEVARRVTARYVDAAIGREIDLGFEADCPDTPWIRGHGGLMEEMIANLIDNAVRYTPKGGTVTVQVLQQKGRPVLRVSDSGPGIPETEWQAVFNRHYRSDTASSAGAGLGLAIVQEIASQYQATARLTPPAPGYGCCFEVSF
ncbi:sensor histidine kinase [Leeia oryzae]|uniref:sensor histidine kinase n=1 Tax=Leeia oryzae TaxID=356662 RepID=UPI00035DF2F2|nr:sensor histidine kinase [Leeia oryzae]